MNVNQSNNKYSDYSNVLDTLKEIKNEAKQKGKDVGITDKQLAIASYLGDSKSLGAHIVRYLIGVNFSFLTSVVLKTLKDPELNSNLSANKKLSDNFKQLIESKQKEIELKSSNKITKNEKKICEKFKDVFNEIISIQKEVKELSDKKTSDNLFELLKKDNLELIEAFVNDKLNNLSEHQKSRIDSNIFAIQDCLFVKQNSQSFEELTQIHEESLRQGKSILVYQDKNNCTLLTPTLEESPLSQKTSIKIDISKLPNALTTIQSAIMQSRKEIIEKTYPFLFSIKNHEVIPELKINYQQNIKDISKYLKIKEDESLDKLKVMEETIFKKGSQIGLIIKKEGVSGEYKINDENINININLKEGVYSLHKNIKNKVFGLAQTISLIDFIQFKIDSEKKLNQLTSQGEFVKKFKDFRDELYFNDSFDQEFEVVLKAKNNEIAFNYIDEFSANKTFHYFPVSKENFMDDFNKLSQERKLAFEMINDFVIKNKLVNVHKNELKKNDWGIEKQNNEFFLVRLHPNSKQPLSVKIPSFDQLDQAKEIWEEEVKFLDSSKVTVKTLKERSNLSSLEIPKLTSEEKNNSDLNQLVKIFDEINFTDPNKPFYRNPLSLKNDGLSTTPKALREGLELLIARINNKAGHSAVPLDQKEKEVFYDQLENCIRHIILESKKRLDSETEDKNSILNEIQSQVLVLAEGGSHCGTRWKTDAMQIYRGLIKGWEVGNEFNSSEILLQTLDRFKLNIAEEMASHASDVSHSYLYINKTLGQEGYLLPGFEEANYNDPYQGVSNNKEYSNSKDIIKGFNEKISSLSVVKFVKDDFNERINDPQKRTPIMAILNEFARKDENLSTEFKKIEQEKEEVILNLKKNKNEQQPLTDDEQKLLKDCITLGKITKENRKKIESIIEKKGDKVLEFEVIQGSENLKITQFLNQNEIFISSFDDQIESTGSLFESKINEVMINWLEEKEFIKLTEDEITYVDKTEITFKGAATLLKHFNFIKQN